MPPSDANVFSLRSNRFSVCLDLAPFIALPLPEIAQAQTGACCERTFGTCTDGVTESNCDDQYETWHPDELCADIGCGECEPDEMTHKMTISFTYPQRPPPSEPSPPPHLEYDAFQTVVCETRNRWEANLAGLWSLPIDLRWLSWVHAGSTS